jgi:hypothetical protein
MCSKSADRNKKNKEELEDRTPMHRGRIPGKILVFAERGHRTLKYQELA